MSKAKMVSLTGAETAVEFDRPFAYVECNNLSDAEVLLSTKPNIKRGADDVIIIKAGNTATIGDIGTPSIETVYLTGSGEVQLIGKGYAQSSFKAVAKGGGENTGANDHVVHFSSHNLLADYDVNTNICTKTQDGDTVTYSIEGYKNTGWYQIIKGATLKKGKMYKLTVDENYYGCGILGIATTYSNSPSTDDVVGNFASASNVISNGNTNTKYFYIGGNNAMGSDKYFGLWIKITVDVERFPYSFNIGLYEEI